jgi:hypothetical protein
VSNIWIGVVTALAAITSVGLTLLQYRTHRPHLRVTVYVHDLSLPTFLRNYLRQLLQNERAPGLEPDNLAVLVALRGYARFTLQNRGREKIQSLTLTLTDPMSKYVFQLDQQVEPLRPQNGKVSLGDLQPHQSMLLHIWSDRLLGYFITTQFPFTADNLYKQTFRVPFPTYLHYKIREWLFLSLLIGIVLLGLFPTYKSYLPFLPLCR